MTSPSRTSWLSSKTQPTEEPSFYSYLSSYVPDSHWDQFASPQVAAGFALGAASAMGAVAIYVRYFKRIPTAEWVHPKYIAKKKWIKGVVTSVGDADNFRLYHTPGPFWRWPLKLRKVPVNAKDLKDETIHIRMAGVDAPEASHFGKPAQPYAPEALAWLKNEVEGKRIWVQMIRRDQYGRIVSIPIQPPRLPIIRAPASRCVSISMLRAGFATTYEQSGAEYGRWGKEEFLKYEEKARTAKLGMWASKKPLESPSDYKKRHKDGGEAAPAAATTPRNKNQTSPKKASHWSSALRFWR